MPAGLASLVIQTQAIFTMALAHVVMGQKTRPRQVLGALVAVSGVARSLALEKMSSIGIRNGSSVYCLGCGNEAVHRVHQLVDLGLPLRLAVQGAQRGAANDGKFPSPLDTRTCSAGRCYLHLHQVDQAGVLHRVALVQEHHDAGHAHWIMLYSELGKGASFKI